MHIVDCHVHVTPDGSWFDSDIDASIDRLLKELDHSPIKKVVLLPVGKSEEELKKATDFIISLVKSRPEKFLGFSAYYPGLDLKQAFENGLAVNLPPLSRQNFSGYLVHNQQSSSWS